MNVERREALRKVRRKRLGPLVADVIICGGGFEEEEVRQGWRLDHLPCLASPKPTIKAHEETQKEGTCFAYSQC